MSALGCLPAFVFCLFCVVVWFCCFGVFLFPVFALLCFWFLFCKCLGIPNSPRSLDLDDRQGLIALWICIGETWGVFTLGDTRK